MGMVEFRLQGDRLSDGAGWDRSLADADRAAFARWIEDYHAVASGPDGETALRALGREIHLWLDGGDRRLERLRAQVESPLLPVFAAETPLDANSRQFLEVPWELAADEAGYLVADPGTMWAPLRRIGPRRDPPGPKGRHRLGALFMAAAPHGPDELDFEAEESAILQATLGIGLDLHVEDSGSLADLAQHWARIGPPEILHLSCHGSGGDDPLLVLEDKFGAPVPARLQDLAGEFTGSWPRLLFLSACHTGEAGPKDASLACGLIRVGFPAVLSWADAVYDIDATAFAAAFYARLARVGTSLETAYAASRFALMQPGPGRRVPAHWHQARLFLGPAGGGILTGGTAPRLRQEADAGHKQLIEARGGTIEVASRFEFVGRRRQIQAIRREFAQPSRAGVVIHGLGRQGKSSLAARILDRLPDLAKVVLYQRCDGPSLLAEIARRVTSDEAAELCTRFRPMVDPVQKAYYDPDALHRALRQLLEGPCGHGGTGILLLLDDFEELLDPPSGPGEWRVKPEAEAPLAAIIEAFAAGNTPSRLLITSRYLFPFQNRGRDLAGKLLAISLPEMSPAESRKQARQKLSGGILPPEGFDPLVPRAIAAARGNAGLQDLLFRVSLADPATGAATIAALESYLAGGAPPDQQELRDTLEGLAIERLVAVLTEGERHILRASTLFRLPLRVGLWTGFAAAAGDGSHDRLIRFGLWERVPDPIDPKRDDAVAVNAIAGARIEPPDDAPQIVIALLGPLFAAWGGADRTARPYAADIELSRLALLCGDLDILAATAPYAIRGLERRFEYRVAAALAADTLDALAESDRPVSVALRRSAAEIFDHVGDAGRLARIYASGPVLGTDDPALPAAERSARAKFRLRYGTYLAKQGDPDQARREFEAARLVFEALGDRRMRAVTLREIARILTDKGEVDQALGLHCEQIATFEALGDRRERAVTLGDIARILEDKGEVDQALTLHRERIATYEALGDRCERTVTLGDIARILRAKGEVDEALALQRERLATNRALEDLDGIAYASADIGHILLDRAEKQQDAEAFQEAFRAFDESYRNLIRIGRLDGICWVGATFGQLLAIAGDREQARVVLTRSVEGYRTLDRPDRAARVEAILLDLARGDDQP